MTRLNVHRFGASSGRPLLAVHGINAHGRRFETLAVKGWPERFTVAVDLRGHGRSTFEPPWSMEQHVADLLDTLDALVTDGELPPGPVDVVGHSLGAVLATHLLAAAPERITRLVLLDPAFERPAEGSGAAAAAVISDPGWDSAEAALAERLAGNSPQAAADVTADVSEHLVLDSDGRYRFRVHRPAVVTLWGELARAMPRSLNAGTPTLLVAATGAGFVTPAVTARLAAQLGGSLEVVEVVSGHMVYWDAFLPTVEAVRSFWDRHPAD